MCVRSVYLINLWRNLTVCVFDCTIYGLCADPGFAPHSLERGQLLLEIYSTSPQSSAKTAELWASSSHPGSRRKESSAEEETCSFFSLSQGLSYNFPNKYEPRETDWLAIHQPGCLHPPEQCVWPPPGTKKVTRGFTSTFSCPVHTQPHPAGGSKPWETLKGKNLKLKQNKILRKHNQPQNRTEQYWGAPLNDQLCNALKKACTIDSHTRGWSRDHQMCLSARRNTYGHVGGGSAEESLPGISDDSHLDIYLIPKFTADFIRV